ncbi:hypothetical protein [Streptomyces erythrochromogenes]|uniref:hypothetical protein n=1 Tax=Streptomyces erythrochromogenes TaxID=285574 RepID=UPI003694C4E4
MSAFERFEAADTAISVSGDASPTLACEYQRGRPPRHTVLARLHVQGTPFGRVVVGAHQAEAEQRVVSVVAAVVQGGDGLRYERFESTDRVRVNGQCLLSEKKHQHGTEFGVLLRRTGQQDLT